MTIEIPNVNVELNVQGLHKVQCPACQSHRVESFLKNASSEFDPNAKLCRACGYAWKQIHSAAAPVVDPVLEEERAFVRAGCSSAVEEKR